METQQTICATGHRPDKLGGYSEGTDNRLRALARMGVQMLDPRMVIVGMALGWDTAVAEAAIELKVPFVAFIPFLGQEKAWPYASQRRYHDLLAQAVDVEVTCSGGYAGWKMQRRNERMVDCSQHVLALWNGTPGGTANCVAYANKCRKPVRNLWDQYVV